MPFKIRGPKTQEELEKIAEYRAKVNDSSKSAMTAEKALEYLQKKKQDPEHEFILYAAVDDHITGYLSARRNGDKTFHIESMHGMDRSTKERLVKFCLVGARRLDNVEKVYFWIATKDKDCVPVTKDRDLESIAKELEFKVDWLNLDALVYTKRLYRH